MTNWVRMEERRKDRSRTGLARRLAVPARPVWCVVPALLLLLALMLGYTVDAQSQTGFPVGTARVGFVTASQVRPEVNRESYKSLITLSTPVRYTIGGTATLGTDYKLWVTDKGFSRDGAGEITSAEGIKTVPIATTVYFHYRCIDDNIPEPDETVIITILDDDHHPPRYVVPSEVLSRTLTLTFTNDDPGPTLSIADARVIEGGGAVFKVSLSEAPAGADAVTVNWATSSVSSDSAVAGTDYTAASGTLTFLAGETQKSVTVQTTADTVPEANETFTVTLSNPSSGTLLGDNVAQGTIENDDALTVTVAPQDAEPVTPQVSLSSGTGGAEGAAVEFTLAADPAPSAPLAVTLSVGQDGDHVELPRFSGQYKTVADSVEVGGSRWKQSVVDHRGNG